jgi:hypothetical protein
MLAVARLDETRRKLADLAELEQAFRHMVAQCDEDGTRGCPIIDSLSSELPRTETAVHATAAHVSLSALS